VHTRDEALKALAEIGPAEQARGISYVYLGRRGKEYPTQEEYFTAAPASIRTKARYGIAWFDKRWQECEKPAMKQVLLEELDAA
jgi:hypothetical protein